MSEFRLVSGIVRGLEITDGRQEILQGHQKQNGVAVAALLAFGGFAGTATGSAVGISGATETVEFFTCCIGDAEVVGAFSKVTFHIGDHVTAVVDGGRGDIAVARAIARRSDSMLCMSLHHSRGLSAHRKFCVKLAVWATLAVIFMVAPFLWFTEPDHGAKAFEHFKFYGPLLLIFSLIVGAYYSVSFYFQWRNIARSAENIFRTFGFKKPESIDLPRENVKASRALGILWPYETLGPWIYRCATPTQEVN